MSYVVLNKPVQRQNGTVKTDMVKQARLAICNNVNLCKKLNKNSNFFHPKNPNICDNCCKVCGCNVNDRAGDMSQHCPDGKW